MGKLHKIRKAIEANPSSFIFKGFFSPCAYGVRFYDTNWHGIVNDGKARPDGGSISHRNYVRKVLCELGHSVR